MNTGELTEIEIAMREKSFPPRATQRRAVLKNGRA